MLLYKYGGWYSDLDMVITRSLASLKNVMASDSCDMGKHPNPEIQWKDNGKKKTSITSNFAH